MLIAAIVAVVAVTGVLFYGVAHMVTFRRCHRCGRIAPCSRHHYPRAWRR